MEWPEYNLSSLTDRFISGGTPDTKVQDYWTGNIPWITGADFTTDGITIGRRYINSSAISASATNIVPKGSILMVTRTGVGKIAIAPVDIAISQDITGIVPKNGVEPEYIRAAIVSKMGLLLAAQRGATIKGITRDDVKRLTIPLPVPSEQRRIVEILNQADQLRKLRAEADKKAERILPALFSNMFGDPVSNPMGWPVVSLGDQEITEINPRTTAKNTVGTTAVSFVPMADVDEVWGRIVGTQTRMYEEVSKGFTSFKEGDVIFAKITPCMQNGKAAIARGLVNGIGFGSTEFHVLRPGCKATAEWIYCLVRMIHFRNAAIQSFTGSGGQQRVPTSFLREYSLPLPSMERQLEFGKLVQDVNNRVPKLQNVKDKIEGLFANLLQRAFSGALTASWRKAHMKELLAEMELQAKYLN